MLKTIKEFLYPSVEIVRAKSLANAQRDHEMHTQAHEYHGAMVAMYQRRIERLQAVQEVAA